MARYIDCEKCYHRNVCQGDTDKWNYYGECPHYINTADVVPKSEVVLASSDAVKMLIECHGYALTHDADIKKEVAREIFEEIEKILADDRINRKLTELGMRFVQNGEPTFEERIVELKKKYT
jgi:hypothetical protein